MPLLLFLACAASTDRAAWLHDALVDDNRLWLDRSSEQLVEKYALMAGDAFAYMRGTHGVFVRDLARRGGARAETAFLTVPEATELLLLGDPHPENFGLHAPDVESAAEASAVGLTMEWVDLDGAAFGPWTVDLRRAALGLATLTVLLDGCDEACRDQAVASLARAYGDEIVARSAGGVGWDAAGSAGELAAGGAILALLVDEVRDEGPENKRVKDNTLLDDSGARAFERDEQAQPDGDRRAALTREEDAQVDRLVEAWVASSGRAPAAFRPLDAIRWYGSGTASLPAIRYRVLWDHGDDATYEDDRILNLREVVDPPDLGVASPFRDNAERLRVASNTLWSRPDADPVAWATADGGQAFKITTWTSWFQDFDREKIADAWFDREVDQADLDALASTLGRSIAAAHARSRTVSGADPLEAVATDLDGRVDLLVSEVVGAAAADLGTLLTDHVTFQGLLAEYGPLLGAELLLEDL